MLNITLQTRYNRLKNHNEVDVSTINQTWLPGKTSAYAVFKRISAPLPMIVLAFVSACATGPELEEVPSGNTAGFPAGTVPAELPPAPVPDVIPGLQEGAESSALVTPSTTQQSVQPGLILGGIEINRESIRDPSHPLSKRIVFFDYNSAQLSAESLDLIRGHGEYLSRFGDVRVRVEGHTDERGSREYNIALGDNRARSVARILQLQGVDVGQFSTLSYGEEVPLDERQSERAWRRNRRVEVVYEGS